MADVTDPSPRQSVAPGAPAPGGPPDPAMPPESSGEGYKSISLLAGAALALVVVYAATIVIGTLVALFLHAPLLLPMWTFVLPAAAILLSWVARTQIQSSEGTLTGLPLTRWSVALSLVFGLCYAMYYTATGVAVRQQAEKFARQWLDDLRKGEVDRAFWLTLRPPRPTLKRQNLEERQISSSEFGSPSTLTGFHLLDFVRLLGESGKEAQVRLGSVSRWTYEKGGYEVTLTYHITAPVAECDLLVTVLGSESREKEFEGRQWHVMMDSTGVVQPGVSYEGKPAVVFREQGKDLVSLLPGAAKAAQDFLDHLRKGDLLSAYQATLPLADRDRLASPRDRLMLLVRGDLAGLVLGLVPVPLEGVRPEDVNRWRAFVRGDLVRPAEPGGFWAVSAAARERALGDVKELFVPGAQLGSKVEVKTATSPNARVPLWSREGSRWRLRFDYQLVFHLFGETAGALLVELRVPVTADVPDPTKPAAVTWQVEGLELLRARAMAMSQRGPGRP